MCSVEFLYFPLNQAQVPHFNVSNWDPLDDKLWITAATRVALPTDGNQPKKFTNDALYKPNLDLNAATYLGWLIAEIAQQTSNLDLQVRATPRSIEQLSITSDLQDVWCHACSTFFLV